MRAARDAAAAERQQRRDEAEAAKKKALARRKKKAAQMRSAPGRLRGQLDDVLAKLESESAVILVGVSFSCSLFVALIVFKTGPQNLPEQVFRLCNTRKVATPVSVSLGWRFRLLNAPNWEYV